jgi:hypothetical protein
MSRLIVNGITAILIATPWMTKAGAITESQMSYRQMGSGDFSSTRGEVLWNKDFPNPKSGQVRNCALCHTNDLSKSGKHNRTGKPIEPMAPSVNPERLTDTRKIEKWLKRNCKWTLGRECTPQEKGDLLAFLRDQ